MKDATISKNKVSAQNNRIIIDPAANSATVPVNIKIYPLEVIYSAAYVFIDQHYLLFKGDPDQEILVEINPKNKKLTKEELEIIGKEFCNELLNYANYKAISQRNSAIRQVIVQRALLTANPELNSMFDDPKLNSIRTPWKEQNKEQNKSFKLGKR